MRKPFLRPLANGGFAVVTGHVVELDSVGVKVIEHADAELRFAIVPQLIPVVRLNVSASVLILPSAGVGPGVLAVIPDGLVHAVGPLDNLGRVLNAGSGPVISQGVSV